MRKGVKFLLTSILIGIIDVVMIAYRLLNFYANIQNEWERLGAQLGINMMAPFLLCLVVGLIFNILAFVKYNKTFALVAAILYVAGIILNVNMGLDLGIAAVFCFIAYARMEKDS